VGPRWHLSYPKVTQDPPARCTQRLGSSPCPSARGPRGSLGPQKPKGIHRGGAVGPRRHLSYPKVTRDPPARCTQRLRSSPCPSGWGPRGSLLPQKPKGIRRGGAVGPRWQLLYPKVTRDPTAHCTQQLGFSSCPSARGPRGSLHPQKLKRIHGGG